MTQIDPTKYRHFLIRGSLLAGGEIFDDIFELCHADDLPAGESGEAEIVERVRQRKAEQIGHPTATWHTLTVTEHAPPDQMWEGSRDELFPL